MTNLLINGNFSDGFAGWQQENGYWHHGRKWNPCESGGDAQADQDIDKRTGQIRGWPTGAEDRLWQDVAAPAHYSQVTFRSQEIHHHGENVAEIRIYGFDGSQWTQLWRRPALDFPATESQRDWTARQYSFAVEQAYPQLRLEFYARIDAGIEEGEQCGWKFSCLELLIS